MKKLLSILLIVSTLFMSIGLQACFAKNQPESETNNISQNVEEDKVDQTLKSVDDLENQIKTLETELKKQGQRQEKSRGILSSLSSFVRSKIDLILTYCLIYGAAKTYFNWSNYVLPVVNIPLSFVPVNNEIPSLKKDVLTKIAPDTTIPVNVYEIICNKCAKSDPALKDVKVDCSTAGAPLKNPLDKWAFFTVFDAPCSLVRAANSIYNSFNQ